MEENEKQKLIVKYSIACLLSNVLVLALFSLIAIAFKKWWIVLFSGLYWYTIGGKGNEKTN